jgi:RHS repeat-associated protein
MKTARGKGMTKSAFTLTRQAGQVWRSYYYAGAARVAMREVNDDGSEVYYILTDHLGSTSITVNDAGQRTAQQWYKPWGEVREVWGVLPTDYTFTGQREEKELGMLWYNSRFYDSQLGRFNQPDTGIWILLETRPISYTHTQIPVSPIKTPVLEPDKKAWLADRVSDLTSLGPVMLDGMEGAKSLPSPLLAISFGASAYAQWERDDEFSNHPSERGLRAVVVGTEGLISSIIGNGVGLTAGLATTGVFSPTGPVAPVAGIASYTTAYYATVATLTNTFNQFNETRLFPIFNP